jgi:hypothetical protein
MTDNDEHMLARLDERVAAMQQEIHRLRTDLERYLSLEAWWPYKALLIGLTGAVGTAVIGWIMAKALH